METKQYQTFKGLESFHEFFDQNIVKTHNPADLVLREDFLERYARFCKEQGVPMASPVNMGRYLSKIGFKASVRVGGTNGTGQKYAYPGLRWVTPSTKDNLSLPKEDLPLPKDDLPLPCEEEGEEDKPLPCEEEEEEDLPFHLLELGEEPLNFPCIEDGEEPLNPPCEEEGEEGTPTNPFSFEMMWEETPSEASVKEEEEEGEEEEGGDEEASLPTPSVTRPHADKITFLEFFSQNVMQSPDEDDLVVREQLVEEYRKYCQEQDKTDGLLSLVAMGRVLGKMGFHASVRIGGKMGCGQKWAYPGLCWVDGRFQNKRKKRRRAEEEEEGARGKKMRWEQEEEEEHQEFQLQGSGSLWGFFPSSSEEEQFWLQMADAHVLGILG